MEEVCSSTNARKPRRRYEAPPIPDKEPARPALVGRVISLGRDATLCREGESPHHVWLVRSGILRVQRMGVDGKRQILALLLPGDLVGDEFQGRRGLSIETCTEATLSQMRLTDFRAAMEASAELRRACLLGRMVHLERMRWLTWILGALKPEERLCAFLSIGGGRILGRQPQPDGSEIVAVPLSRQDLSDLLGITVESISRILHRLQDDGILRILDPARFRIWDAGPLLKKGGVDADFGTAALGGADVGDCLPEPEPELHPAGHHDRRQ
ncbi:Crp/Fnr family transcriptional regulator [Cereibacter sphaeroides]|uniref:Crp/Fnr family transcriptional regulator n=1 Tax=Rhodobacterales TaxID=204455 RepID=UPI001E2D257E|nr:MULTISPECIES: Crp/Fnr family transcriptional regulator [Paracoccaceae]MCE6960654.1 Crp/Fnr family transcriptional regulator [Cereibacter sphaeroides]MCE6970079.1 Crp/Fnr family transcriptional regulator [Cereibacter sphaeroides]MCE6973244.1 Crp/Fnr family transcriptional regulator [Cereibacter sphaeroides]